MSFLDYLSRERSGASSLSSSSPSSRSDGLPFFAASTTGSTPNGEPPRVTLPSYSELIARLRNLDVDHTLSTTVAPVDPRLTPPHCTVSYTYSSPQQDPHPELLGATHYHCRFCRQPDYHAAAPLDFGPAVESTHNHTYECLDIGPCTYTHERQRSPASGIITSATTSSSSSSDPFSTYEPDGYERVYELESRGITATKPKFRRVRREQPLSKSRQAFQAAPRTTIKPARSKSAPATYSLDRIPRIQKRFRSHPMPLYATLFPKGIRNYTCVPHDEEDARENYFTDEELMEMMPSGYQRWQDAVNQYKPPVPDVNIHEIMRPVSDVDDARCAPRQSKKTGELDDRRAKLWQCDVLLEDGRTRCRYRQTKQAVTRHINDTHFGFRRWPCPFGNCEKQFKQRTSMNIHVYSMHTGQKPFACEHCTMRFSDPAQRHEHCKSDHKDIPMMTRKRKAYSSDEDEEAKGSASDDYDPSTIHDTVEMDVDIDKKYCSDDH